jgi:two-component system phosphate regulon sensor histidine kinase PhoR
VISQVPYLNIRGNSTSLEDLVQALESAGFRVGTENLGPEWSNGRLRLASKIYLMDETLVSGCQQKIQDLIEENNRLRKYAQAREQYIRLVTHELKSPIAAVENYLKMILQGYIKLADQEQVLERCVIRTCQERQLIDDLLDLSRLEGESIPTEPVQLDLILGEVLHEYQDDFDEKELQVTVEIMEGIPPVLASARLLKSVWCNLISNALKYTPEGGRIDVGLAREESKLVGWVEDTGIGIPKADQNRLFQEFFRSDNVKNLAIPGTGLGLVIVKKILVGVGGSISVSSHENQGSRFQFSIPLPTT